MLLQSILQANGLTEPDGRPVFHYHFLGTEYEILREEVHQASLLSREVEFAAEFCIWAVRRLRSIGSGEPSTLSWGLLGLDLPRERLVELTDLGMAYLRRPIYQSSDDSSLRLISLYLEGGLPLRMIEREFAHTIELLLSGIRNGAIATERGSIRSAIDELGTVLTGLKMESLVNFTLGIARLAEDEECSSTPPSDWTVQMVRRTESNLGVVLPEKFDWIMALAKGLRRNGGKRKCGVSWTLEADGEFMSLGFLINFPSKLPRSTTAKSEYYYLVSGPTELFVARYEPSNDCLRLAKEAFVSLQRPADVTSMRLIARDENREPIDTSVEVGSIMLPDLPVLLSARGSPSSKFIVVPSPWVVSPPSLNLSSAPEWTIVAWSPELSIHDEFGFTYSTKWTFGQRPLHPTGWEDIEGAYYRGRPVRASLPRDLSGWVADRSIGQVRFRFPRLDGSWLSSTDEAVLPGLQVSGYITLSPQFEGLAAEVLWEVQLPESWRLLEDEGAELIDHGLWRVKRPLRLAGNREAPEPFRVSDGMQTLDLHFVMSPQIFIWNKLTRSLSDGSSLDCWNTELDDRWWVFRTTRVNGLDILSDSGSKVAEIALRRDLDLIHIPPLLEAIDWRHVQGDLLVKEKRAIFSTRTTSMRSGRPFHTELRIRTRNFSVTPRRDTISRFAKGQRVDFFSDLPPANAHYPRLQAFPFWLPDSAPIQVSQEGPLHWLPEGAKKAPRGAYLLYSEESPLQIRPTIFIWEMGAEFQGTLSEMQEVSRGDIVNDRLRKSLGRTQNFSEISRELYRWAIIKQASDPMNPDWNRLWLLLERFQIFGHGFLFQFQEIAQMLRLGNTDSVKALLALFWTFGAGARLGVPVDAVKRRLGSYLRWVGPFPQVPIRLTDLTESPELFAGFLSAVPLIPEALLRSQPSLALLLNSAEGMVTE